MNLSAKCSIFCTTIVACTLMHWQLNAQDKITLSGGLNLGGEAYDVDGIDNRRSPLSYSINGRLSLSYKGVSLPITASFRDAQFSYDYTFNRLGIAPSYKWVKLYLGWNTMNFSQYTMAGRAFYGYGAALSPGILRFNFMKGNIQNPLAIRDTLLDGANLIPTYERNVIGIKLGLENRKNKFELIYLKIADDVNTFTYPSDYTKSYGYQVLTPKENVTIGINGAISLFKKLDLYMNTGLSAFTADATDTLLIKYGSDVPTFAADIFQANSTSRFSVAGDAGLSFRFKGNKIGIKYRRVDPFYTTLASNYFINDVEQYTFQLGLSAFKRKIKWDNSLGLEKNNLTLLRTNTTDRVIINSTVQFIPNESLNGSIKYSNFQTESQNNVLNLNDTLRFVSVTSEYGTQWTLRTKTKSKTLTYSLSAFYNLVSDQSEIQQIGDINIISLAISHGHQFTKSDFTIQPSFLYNQYNYSAVKQQRIGGGLKVSKRFLDKKLNVGISGTYSYNLYNDKSDGDVSLMGLTTSYRLSKKSNINLNTTYRITNSLINRSFTEWRAMLRYGINF